MAPPAVWWSQIQPCEVSVVSTLALYDTTTFFNDLQIYYMQSPLLAFLQNVH